MEQTDVNGADLLTPFDKSTMKQMIVVEAQLLRLIYKYPEIPIYACGSYPCENYFSYLRIMAHGNNKSEKAINII